jgi:aminoglycoside/choline kinase family phosphotransferase
MADNIMVVGQQPVLLDFQDAVLGNPAYDLVSFLQDARRDISDAVRIECHRHFFKESAIKQIILRKCYNILGLQRNLKIIGIFTRRHLQDDVDKYLGYLPRVWGHIHGSLDYKFTHPLKLWFEKYGLLRYS